MQLEVRAAVAVERPPEEVFDFAVACESFPRILHRLGPIPAITHLEMLDGRPLETGARRRVELGDGSMLLELIVALERPTRHRYRWLGPPAAPFNLLVEVGEGDWIFSAHGTGTRIEWTYTFTLTTALVYPLAWLVLGLFRRWMQRGLDRIPVEIARLHAR